MSRIPSPYGSAGRLVNAKKKSSHKLPSWFISFIGVSNVLVLDRSL